MIARQVEYLARLVDDLLDVARITEGKITLKKERLDLLSIIGRALETSRPLIDARKHRLTVALPEEPLRLEGDTTRLTQVVANLLHNAAKFTPEGGQIWLAAEADNGQVVLRVRDTGTLQDRADRIVWVKFASVAWTKDASGFFYLRFPEPGTVPTADEQYYG